jgi:hypothetical protein
MGMEFFLHNLAGTDKPVPVPPVGRRAVQTRPFDQGTYQVDSVDCGGWAGE